MLIGLAIRDVVLIESLDLSFGPGLTVLTGETGAGKSIILDALGLATGARGDAALIRRGAAQALASAIFAPAPDDPAWSRLDEMGLAFARDEDLVLRRSLNADGRSRAFVNDQAAGVAALRELGGQLIEVHGQHETSGLLDARTHRALLDAFAGCESEAAACGANWHAWRGAREAALALRADQARTAAEAADLAAWLNALDALSPREGEEAALSEERALLGAAEKTLGDLAAARDYLTEGGVVARLAQAARALERARERATRGGVGEAHPDVRRIAEAAQATDRALIEATEAAAAIDVAAEAFDLDPDRLEKAEERLFALRAMARKLAVPVDGLAAERASIAGRLMAVEDAEAALAQATAREAAARQAYFAAAAALSMGRRAAADRLAAAVQAELAPLKLGKARFRVAVTTLPEDRVGPHGADKVEFEISTLPDAPFSGLAAIASGGELARFALALKASLAGRAGGPQPLMIFDEVDQGVGGAVADAVGQRLGRLATGAQVVVVTHSPQVAARADAHWRVSRIGQGERTRTVVEVLGDAAREEEIARMLSGAKVTDAARAAARALMHA
ncbi:MAG: DNA repair protein RecN [Caulobacteraceae bacterium]